MKKLVIIDGKSVYYRGYYAMGALSTKDGSPTGGIYGFATIALELVQKIRPDKVVVAWDKAGTSIAKRKEIYADYKAGRVKPPEDFYAQIPMLKELIDSLNWGFLECDNYEADDIIGTLAKQADMERDWSTIIISSDLDMLQIVDENTKMYRLLKGFSRLEEMDVVTVEEKYGIKKAQFLDLKALKGDASDNIPGVAGIGEKGAVKLLNEYGSLEGVYEHIDEIKGAMHKKLEEGKDSAMMSYELAKIMFDAPVKLAEVPDFRLEAEKVKKVLERLEFYSIMRKFNFGEKKVGVEDDGMGNDARGDVKNDARDGMRGGAGSDVGDAEGEMRDDATNDAEMKILKDEIVDWDVKGMMHEDARVAERILAGAKFWDLGQGEFLLDPLMRKRKEDEQLKLEMENEKKKRLEEEYGRQMREFSGLVRLYKIFKEFDLPLIPILFKMERKGVKIDRRYFEELKIEIAKNVKEIQEKIYVEAGGEFNINSPLQLSGVLFERLGLSTKGIKKKMRAYSTGVKELEKLKDLHPIVPMIMEYRELSKLLTTYITPLPELADKNDVIHTTFTQNVTATGRLSSVNPNLQNLPVRTEEGRRIRRGFVAREGCKFVSADYAQFELRLAAVLARDEALINDFNSGLDIHTKTAADVFGLKMEEVTKEQRRVAKVINFGVLYGMSVKGLADATGMGWGEAKRFIEDYFAVRKPIRDYLDKLLDQARREGYVETYYGRRRPTPDVKSTNFIVRTGAERAAMNMPIQGTEADLMKRAMILVDAELPEGAELILQVHDSLVVECEEGLVDEVGGVLRRVMEGVAPELKVKLDVEISSGDNWGEL